MHKPLSKYNCVVASNYLNTIKFILLIAMKQAIVILYVPVTGIFMIVALKQTCWNRM